MLDLEARKTIKVIPVAEVVQRISMSQDGALGLYLRPEASPPGRDRYHDQRSLQLDRFARRRIRHRVHARRQMAAGDAAERQPGGRGRLVSDESGAHRFRCAADPVQILVRPGVAYVSCTGDGKVAVLNLESWKVEKLIETGPGADGLAWVGKKALKNAK